MEVRADSPANRAGIEVDDLILTIDGAKVSSFGDMLPNVADRSVDLGTQRNGQGVAYHRISLERFKRSLPTDILSAVIVLVIASGILLLFMAPTAGIITWVERRVSGRMQARIGPNRAGPQGFFVWVADGIKCILKEDIIPADSDKLLFRLAPYLVFMGVSATFVVMPFGQYLIAADLDIGILFVIAVTSLVTIGLLTGGWASNNKWSLIGGVRSAAQIISYEIPGAIAVACLVMMTGSLRMQDLIAAQGGPGGSMLATGGWPWYWYVFRTPVTFALFFLYFTTALAEGNRAPFDLPEAESAARGWILNGVFGDAVPFLFLRRVGQRFRDERHCQRVVLWWLADPRRLPKSAGIEFYPSASRRTHLPVQELGARLRRDLDPLDSAPNSDRPDDEPLLEVLRAPRLRRVPVHSRLDGSPRSCTCAARHQRRDTRAVRAVVAPLCATRGLQHAPVAVPDPPQPVPLASAPGAPARLSS